MCCLVRAFAQLRSWLEMSMSNGGMMMSRGKQNKLRKKNLLQKQNLHNNTEETGRDSESLRCDTIPKEILRYHPKGLRTEGRPLKRWKDSVL
jgi:hypothetical protein